MSTFLHKWVPQALLLGCAVGLSGCDELPESLFDPLPGNTNQETPNTQNPETEEPVTDTPSPVIDECVAPSLMTIASVTDAGDYDQANSPENTMDGDISTRWSSSGAPKWISFNLGRAATVTEMKVAFFKGDERTAYFYVETSLDNSTWTSVYESGTSSGTTEAFEPFNLTDSVAQYVRISGNGTNANAWNSYTEVQFIGCQDDDDSVDEETPVTDIPAAGDLDPEMPPSSNFDLTDWYLSIPTDDDSNGKADSIKESELNNGYEQQDYFYTAADGGMVFRTTIAGYKTSAGTNYTRAELREMLRRGDTSIGTTGVNKNNWVFGSTTTEAKAEAGGVNGVLTATLAVNHVTTTGDSSQVGRVIVGQIHANDDEPLRLYYRKLPNNEKGSVYFAHEPITGEEQWIEMIGSRSDSAENPIDGIELNEVFSYRVTVTNNTLVVTLYREGKSDIIRSVDMTNSGFDDPDQYHYFKAGVYNQNKSGDDDDYVQATFYSLENSHDGYEN